jgi:hypothetical protein
MRATGEEACVDFAAFILRLLDYDSQDRVIHQRKEISFVMAGQRVNAKPDVCVMNYTDYVLLVQEDMVSEATVHACRSFISNIIFQQSISRDDPQPQIIAAIAAFYQNNLVGEQAGLSRLPSNNWNSSDVLSDSCNRAAPSLGCNGAVPTECHYSAETRRKFFAACARG